MDVTVELLNGCSEKELPSHEDFQRWTEAALSALDVDEGRLELSIRLIDEAESAHLNERFRYQKGPANVLSFPFSANGEAPVELLGDLAICAPLVSREAAAQNKPVQAHWAHLTVHGVLHLHGYQHEDEKSAAAMENLEIHVLRALGYEDPYN